MYRNIYIVFIFVICSLSVYGQIDSMGVGNRDTLGNTVTMSSQDTVSMNDTTSASAPVVEWYKPQFRISPDALPVRVKYGSRDSTYFDLKGQSIELWGDAYLKYQSYDLKAGYIKVNFKTKEATARDIVDSTGLYTNGPQFTDGSNDVDSKSLRFNFDTKKAFSRQAKFEQGGFYIWGDKTKFVPGADSSPSDSMTRAQQVEDMIFQKHARITTCNHDHPHFHIRTRRIKIIKDKLAVIGFSQLVIAGVPTPLFLPFGLFPMVDGESSGLIFPNNYEYDKNLGFGLRGVGYYFPINDYMNLTLKGDIYTRGTHRINLNSNFKKRYRYSGNVEMEYANNILENQTTAKIESSKSYLLRMTLNQDAKAHPYRRFSGSVNIQTRQHNRANYSDFNSKYQNILSSSLSYSNSMPWTPFSYSVGLTHQQNINTHQFEVAFPNINVNMNRIQPFKNKEKVSNRESWYEKINVRYDAGLKNNLVTRDTILFTQKALDAMTAGFRQNGSIDADYKVLKYINIRPSASVEHILFGKKNNRFLDLDNPVIDTTRSDITPRGDTLYRLDTSYVIKDKYEWGLHNYHKLSAGVSASTKIFGTVLLNSKRLRGIRHTASPTLSFSYTSPTDQYLDTVYRSPIQELKNRELYNPYTGGGYSISTSGRSMSINYGISNNIEGKYVSRKTGEEKKFPIFRSLSFNGQYNFAKDSLRWSPLSFNGNTEIIKGYTDLRVSGAFSFYKMVNGREINTLVWEEDKRLFEFAYTDITLSTGFNIGQLRDLWNERNGEAPTQRKGAIPSTTDKKPILTDRAMSIWDYLDDFRISHSYRLRIERLDTGRDSVFTQSHYLSAQGSLPLTKNWTLNVDNLSFDLKKMKIVYPSFRLSRALHCWQMNLSWEPSNSTYSFFIGVRSPNLEFLKYNYGQRNPRALLGRF